MGLIFYNNEGIIFSEEKQGESKNTINTFVNNIFCISKININNQKKSF